MKSFKDSHPIVSLTYFLGVLGFSMSFFNPITLVLSLAAAFCHCLILRGKRAIRFNLFYMLPMVLLTAIINPIFNHEGITVLARFSKLGPVTLEAVLYGITSGIMLWSVICHFSCVNEIMTEDKISFFLGRLTPSLALIFTMILRFVPRFKVQINEIRTARYGIGEDLSQGKTKDKIRNGVKILSAMAGWSMENAIETADSMKSRGYGASLRTSYSLFRFGRGDMLLLLWLFFLGIAVIASAAAGMFKITYYPYITFDGITTDNAVGYAVYTLFVFCPVIIEAWEEVKWKKLKSGI